MDVLSATLALAWSLLAARRPMAYFHRMPPGTRRWVRGSCWVVIAVCVLNIAVLLVSSPITTTEVAAATLWALTIWIHTRVIAKTQFADRFDRITAMAHHPAGCAHHKDQSAPTPPRAWLDTPPPGPVA